MAMNCRSGHLKIAASSMRLDYLQQTVSRPSLQSLFLLLETGLVTVSVVALIKLIALNPGAEINWLITSTLLVTAALVPSWIKKDGFPRIGFEQSRLREMLTALGQSSVLVFPGMFLVLWVLKLEGYGLPLRPGLPHGTALAGWLLYQFMYVAVAEELFFRGYIQGNILRSAKTLMRKQWGLQSATGRRISIVASAAIFAAAHVFVHCQAAYILTFLPGLVLGWLFVRTKSLLAPILFHGLANIFYGAAALLLA
jgi:membrane protease YdiL (CAAX protease family)